MSRITLLSQGRASRGPTGGSSSKGEHKKDMSKVKCFACHKTSYYVSQCPNRKGKDERQTAASAQIEDFAKKFER